ncbi:MAG: tRNA pseudouridine(13) synthase TruD [Caldimicrobium sp.]
MSYKIKVLPEDFIVSEVSSLSPSGDGEFSLYLLKKWNLTTWEALGSIAKKWRIPLKHFGYGGLKDKKAISYQYITIKNGPKKDLKDTNFELIYLGKTKEPMNKEKLLGNTFEIRVREVEIEEDVLKKEIEKVKNYGLPNYFDEQRFSSIKECKAFPVKEIILGNFEKALYLILAYSSFDEISHSKKLRECLKNNWRKWEKCLPLAKLKWEKDLLSFLIQHKSSQRTFKRALHLLDQEFLFFLGNVYQSFLWNEVLKEVLSYLNLAHFKIPFLWGELYFYDRLNAEEMDLLKNLKIPFPSPRLQIEDAPKLPLKSLYLKVLQNEGFSDFKNLRTFIKGLVFKTYPRPALLFPQNLVYSKEGEKIYLFKFFLEKSSFATLVIKRLFYVNSSS